MWDSIYIQCRFLTSGQSTLLQLALSNPLQVGGSDAWKRLGMPPQSHTHRTARTAHRILLPLNLVGPGSRV